MYNKTTKKKSQRMFNKVVANLMENTEENIEKYRKNCHYTYTVYNCHNPTLKLN